LYFAPSLDTPSGVYPLILRGKLIYEGLVLDIADVPVTAIVANCNAVLDLDNLSLPVIENLWYAETAVYDLTYIRTQVIPSYECGYPYIFELAQVHYDEFGEHILDLPGEINYVSPIDDPMIILDIGKCHPIGEDSPVDPECNDSTIPYTKNWQLRMKITLVQPDGDHIGFVDFPATILDPCVVDQVEFVNLMPTQIPYVLRHDPYVETYEVGINQKYALCPLTCSLHEPNSGGTIPISVKQYTDEPIAVDGPNPSVKL